MCTTVVPLGYRVKTANVRCSQADAIHAHPYMEVELPHATLLPSRRRSPASAGFLTRGVDSGGR